MLLTIDLGNTSLKLAIYEKEKKLVSGLYDTKQDEYGAIIKNFLYRNNLNENVLEDCIISSVVPKANGILKEDLKKININNPIFIDAKNYQGITIDTPNPEETGADLIVLCAYAYHLYKKELFIVSFGTASVICHVTNDGIFKHCIIAPGYGKIAESLWSNGAKLPKFEPNKTDSFVANTTIGAMNVGAYQGYIGLIRYLLVGLKSELSINPKIIACGGYGKEIVKDIKEIEYYEPDMVLDGLNYIYRRYIKNEINLG